MKNRSQATFPSAIATARRERPRRPAGLSGPREPLPGRTPTLHRLRPFLLQPSAHPRPAFPKASEGQQARDRRSPSAVTSPTRLLTARTRARHRSAPLTSRHHGRWFLVPCLPEEGGCRRDDRRDEVGAGGPPGAESEERLPRGFDPAEPANQNRFRFPPGGFSSVPRRAILGFPNRGGDPGDPSPSGEVSSGCGDQGRRYLR